MKYKELLSQTQEQKDQVKLDHTVASAKLQVQKDLLETQLVISERKNSLQKALSANPFSLATVVQLKQEIAAYEEALALAETVVAELFD